MKNYFIFGITLICTLILTSCCEYMNGCYNQKQPDLLHECWMREVNINPAQWTSHADTWFFNGEPNRTENAALHAPASQAITVLSVRATHFNRIVINGSFQVQILGDQDENSVSMMGPNEGTQQTKVEVRGKTLYVYQLKESKANLSNVIVRIGVPDLRSLRNDGSGIIYGRNIISSCLHIFAQGNGSILLSGNMNLDQVTQVGSGCIVLLGANTPALTIKNINNGTINISGRVGVQSIVNQGNGSINIIGADSDALCIFASGSSKTGISGMVNVKKIIALKNSRVYLFWSNSNNIDIQEKDNAQVGLAGVTQTLNVTLSGNSQFLGQRLKTQKGYVRTIESSHANVNASRSLFTSATGHSSIYSFGPPEALERNTSEQGVVISMCNDKSESFVMPTQRAKCYNYPK